MGFGGGRERWERGDEGVVGREFWGGKGFFVR